MITIQFNGEAKEIPDGLTVGTLLEWLNLPADRVAVERNLEIVPRDRWREMSLRAGDRLEVVHLVGGGSRPSATTATARVGGKRRWRFASPPGHTTGEVCGRPGRKRDR